MMTIKEKAVKRYNKVMMDLGYEHVTIGTEYSEMYDENTTIAKMVEEAEFWLDTYYEEDHANGMMKEDNKKLWVSETGKLKRFINAFKGIEEEPAKEEPKAEEIKTEEVKEEEPAKKEEVQKDQNAPKTQKEKIAERIEKNETKLEKAKALLAKKEAKAAKKSEMDEFEYSYLLEEIEGKKYQIEELEALIERQRKQLETAKDEISEKTKKELIMKQLPELPKVLKDLRDDLETRIFDMLIRENEDKKSYKRDEEVLKRDSAYEANLLVKDVWAKIFEKTGNLIECDVYNGGWQINGIFKGEKGTAKVQTVFAGGYNIQCLHMRTLVHEI